jgi:hypothetical protein
MEQHLLGMVDWFVKDPDAWDLMCGWWVSEDFRAVSRLNRLSKSSVHLYDTDGHIGGGGGRGTHRQRL